MKTSLLAILLRILGTVFFGVGMIGSCFGMPDATAALFVASAAYAGVVSLYPGI